MFLVTFSSGTDYIIANIAATGFFRVNYPDGNWEKLSEKLKATTFEVIS